MAAAGIDAMTSAGQVERRGVQSGSRRTHKLLEEVFFYYQDARALLPVSSPVCPNINLG